MDPPALTCQAVGPTRGPQAKNRKPIGKLGHALDFVAIGKLGNALDFVNIGILGNCSDIAKIANVFGWENASGGGEGEKPQSLAILAKLSCLLS